MTSAPLHLLVYWLGIAIFLAWIAWRLWREGQKRFYALEAWLFKRTLEGWTFDAPYPPSFSRRRWTYLLTDPQKERLTEGLRRWMRTTPLLIIGLIMLELIPLAIWLPKLPDFLRWVRAGSPGVWLLLCLVLVLACGTIATATLVAQERLFNPVLRDARRIGPAVSVSLIRLTAETTSLRELRSRIIWDTLALLASVTVACVAAYLLPSSLEAEVLLLMAVVFGLSAIWYVKVLVFKLRRKGRRSAGHGALAVRASGSSKAAQRASSSVREIPRSSCRGVSRQPRSSAFHAHDPQFGEDHASPAIYSVWPRAKFHVFGSFPPLRTRGPRDAR
jgi:hypothetical protein